MDIKTAFFLAYTSLKRGNKGTLAMTILIMTLAYVNLVFVASIFGGIVNAINQEAINNQYGNIVITPAPDKVYIEKNNAVPLIYSLPGVTGVTAHYIDDPVFQYNKNGNGQDMKRGRWIVKSIYPPDEKRVTQVYKSMIAGSYLQPGDRDKIILGVEIAGGPQASLNYLSLGGVKVGDKVDVYFTNGIWRRYTVKGIFKTKSTQVNQMAFITKSEMESILKVHNWASEILVKIKHTGEEDKYIRELRRIGFKNEIIQKWSDLMGFTESASKSFDMVSIILGAIGTLVAGITIFIIIFVSVVNKRKQIGILKAIGMREGTIVLYFVLQALFFGIIGIIIGAGLILFVIRPYFASHPLNFPVGWVSLKVTFEIIRLSNISILIASLIGGFIPAYRGAKESILKSLWN